MKNQVTQQVQAVCETTTQFNKDGPRRIAILFIIAIILITVSDQPQARYQLSDGVMQ